jgi:hypothetical protein
LKHLGITSKTVNTLLNARAAAIVEANDRYTSFHGSIHNFADFLGVHLAEGASKHSKILRKHKNRAAVDGALARHHRVTKEVLLVHAKVVATVIHKLGRRHREEGTGEHKKTTRAVGEGGGEGEIVGRDTHLIVLPERARVQQHGKPLSGCKLAFRVLSSDALLASSRLCLRLHFVETTLEARERKGAHCGRVLDKRQETPG